MEASNHPDEGMSSFDSLVDLFEIESLNTNSPPAPIQVAETPHLAAKQEDEKLSPT